jgi:serine phosphatase RsbU (regulator of sigma subunit)
MMPAEICTRMNDALSGEDNESSMFVTFFLGLVNLKTGHLDFCNAGHNPPVLGTSFLNMKPNTAIGLFPGLEYQGEEIESIMNETLFVYTDGLNEAENMEKQQFGDEHLLEVLKQTQHESAQQTVEKLKEEVARHRDGAEPNDDLTMMCLRISGVVE